MYITCTMYIVQSTYYITHFLSVLWGRLYRGQHVNFSIVWERTFCLLSTTVRWEDCARAGLWLCRDSVANSWQNFPASSAEKFGRWGKNSAAEEKIRPLRKKFGPLVTFTLCKAFVVHTHKLSLSMSVAKVKYFLDLHRIRVNKEVKIHFLKVRSLFGPFCTKLAKVRPQICTVAQFFFGHFWLMWPKNQPVSNTVQRHHKDFSQG